MAFIDNPILKMFLRRGFESLAVYLISSGALTKDDQTTFVTQAMQALTVIGYFSSLAWGYYTTQRKRKEVVAARSLPDTASMQDIKDVAKELPMAVVKQIESSPFSHSANR